VHHPYISCINSGPGPLQKHYHSSLKGHTSIDLEFLERLFNESILPSQEECAVIEPLTTRRKFCGKWLLTTCKPLDNYPQTNSKLLLDFDHVQGPGKLEHLKCGVIFTALVPVNIQETPYFVFTSHGIHQHPPPPPHKPPEQILKGIESIIRNMRNPSLTLGK
jgi:hypothetical protein